MTSAASGSDLESRLRVHREAAGLSQLALAGRVGVTRHAVLAIEAGRQVPSTSLALRLAHALGVRVEDLFVLTPAGELTVRLAPGGAGARVALAEVDGRWVAHRLPLEGSDAADGLLAGEGPRAEARVRPLTAPERLRGHVLVAGCAPLLGTLAPRVGARFGDARATWLPAGSVRALELLAEGFVHVAGVHFPDARGEDNAAVIARLFPRARMLLVNLTRWRQGLVVAPGNPLGILSGADLLREGLRFAGREEGTGAERVTARLVESAGGERTSLAGPLARGHAEVARLVQCGAADAGVAVEGVALAAGLGFVPVAEERFDLVVSASLADHGPVARLLDALDDAAFRAEAAELPGYDVALAGHVTTLEAA